MTAPCRLLSLMVLATAAITTPVDGQIVQGQVVDSLSGTPVGRGFVVLIDANRNEVVRTLSSAVGAFSIRAPGPGRYRLRSEVIAYRAWESPPFDVFGEGPTEVTLRIHRVPVRLSVLEVIGDERCDPMEASMDISTVWEEASKALSAAAWTANRQEYAHQLHRFRRVESDRAPLRQEDVWHLTGQATQPFAAIAPDRLASSGYILDIGGRRRYYGPDANVLLDEGFQDTHCFWARRGADEFGGLIGLSFRPVRDRSVADIAGTLWLDAESAELRQIEYQYTEIPFDFTDDRIGGSIHFERLESGAWILSRWEIRTPVVRVEQRMARPGVIGARQVVAGLLHVGGAVIESTTRDGSVEYASPNTVIVSGLAYDSSRLAPLADHMVSIAGTGYTTNTNSAGRFLFKTLLRGPYEISLGRLDSLGFDRGRARLPFEPGTSAEVVVVVPPLETVYRYHCGSGGLSAAQNIVVGMVHDAETGLPIDDVPIEALWANEPGQSDGSLRARSREDGAFTLCPVPSARRLTITTDVDNYTAATLMVELEHGVARIDDGTGSRAVPTPDRVLRIDLNLTASER